MYFYCTIIVFSLYVTKVTKKAARGKIYKVTKILKNLVKLPYSLIFSSKAATESLKMYILFSVSLGMMRSVRKNFFNLVIICDPSKAKCRPLIKMLESFYLHRAPTRIGIIFAGKSLHFVILKLLNLTKGKKYIKPSFFDRIFTSWS